MEQHITSTYFTEGQILLVDKPFEWSSFQAVNALKWSIRKKFNLTKKFKIGHAGTLDPLATGLLLICTGKFTKKIPELQGQKKEYTGTIRLGATTPSYDLETAIDATYDTAHITPALIETTSKQFLGRILQYPPVFSAIRKDGKRLYEYARKGEKVEIKAREIEVYTFEITAINMPDVSFRVVCSKGTYIRSLAHDLGKALKSGGHLTSLRRTKIGDFDVNKAKTPEEYREWIDKLPAISKADT